MGSIDLRANAGRRGRMEVAAKGRRKERAEDDIGATVIDTLDTKQSTRGQATYRKAGNESHRRKMNLNVK